MYKYNTWLKNKKEYIPWDNCTLNVFLYHFLSFLLLVLLVCSHEGGEDTVLLVQQGLGSVVLQDDPPLHHNHQVGIQDGVDAMLCGKGEENQSVLRAIEQNIRKS